MEADGYNVLRLIEHGNICHVSSDYVQGKPLVYWVRYHPNVSKELLFSLMQQIITQLVCFHRLRGEPCYKYVNPYSVIIVQEKIVYMLDMEADANQAAMRQMQRRAVRESFLPQGEAYYDKGSVKLDIYGLGRTLQYLLSVTNPEPAVTKREEIILKKIISKCLSGHSKKAYQNLYDIQRQFPHYKPKQKKTQKTANKKWVFVLSFLALTTLALFLMKKDTRVFQTRPQVKTPQTNERNKKEKIEKAKDTEMEDGQGDSKSQISKEDRLRFKMGTIYFLETQEYAKARECFQEMEGDHQWAKDYAVITGWVSGDKSGSKETFKSSLGRAQQSTPEEFKVNGQRMQIKGYTLIDEKESARKIIQLGKACMKQALEEGTLEESIQKELTEFVAAAYEELGETQNALESYEELLKTENDPQRREELYKKTAFLWEEENNLDMAAQCCLRGIEEFKESVQLRIIYAGILCKNTLVEREICAQVIQQYLAELPEIAQQEEFEKLKKEYDIRQEGEKIWVGR